ncbi:MAG: aminoglycoside 6-N-acetyltransferase [Actinomycetia bacterium]|nr:aminoglycoside 6-N-acetyltransferase [Actinomycetes bacterium]
MELRGEQVVLRPAETGDLAPFTAVFEAPGIDEWWPGEDRAKIARDLLSDDDATVYAVLLDGMVAGIIQSYEETDPDYRHAGLDIALHPDVHDRGVGTDAVRTLARHLIEHDGHHRLIIDPAADNARAIRCYEKVGFRPVGVMRDYERGRDGTFHDGLLMDLLADELT